MSSRGEAHAAMPAAHIVGDFPVPTRILANRYRSGRNEIEVEGIGGTIATARVHDVSAEASLLLREEKTVRLTVERGAIMEIARARIEMHPADLAHLEAHGIGVGELAAWARPLTLWTSRVYPQRRPDIIAPGLRWTSGRPFIAQRWGTTDGSEVVFGGGVVTIPAVPQTIIDAMPGMPIGRFVEIPPLAGRVWTIRSATPGRSGTAETVDIEIDGDLVEIDLG